MLKASHVLVASVMFFVIVATFILVLPSYIEKHTDSEDKPTYEKKLTGNMLLDADYDLVMLDNDQMAYITNVDDLSAITKEDFEEYAEEKVEAINSKIFNWTTIKCGNYGIIFYGSCYYNAEYGKVDSDGSMIKPLGSVTYNFRNKTYSYEPYDHIASE